MKYPGLSNYILFMVNRIIVSNGQPDQHNKHCNFSTE